MGKPTHEDATVMLQLVHDWPFEAAHWIWTDEFEPDPAEFAAKQPRGDEGRAFLAAVLNWYETIGTLYKHGLINEDLLFDWLAIDMVWERVKGHALEHRQESGEPRMFENFEAMAEAWREWASRSRAAA